MNGTTAYVLAKKYVQDTADKMGALKGAPCKIKSIEKTNEYYKVIFQWKDDSGADHTSELKIDNYGAVVEANTLETPTKTLETLKVGDTIYNVPQGSEIIEMSYDEYLALSDEEKNDGTVRYVTDYPASIGGVTIDDEMSSSSENPVQNKVIASALNDKVDKITGKGLSTEDYTSAEKTKLSEIAAGADVNTIESITLNGTVVTPDSNKNVALTVITNAVNDLVNYYLKSETYSKTEVDTIVTAIKNSRFEIVAELPTTEIKTNVIYLVPKASVGTNNTKDEYINLDGTTTGWEKIGSTDVDLSGYVTTSALNTTLANYTTTANLTTLLAGKASASDVTAIQAVIPGTATAQNKLATINDLPQFTPPPFSTATVEEIEFCLKLHYLGIVNLHNYWNIGDSRTLSIGAVSAMGGISSIDRNSQNVIITIQHKGGKELVTPYMGKTTCAFIIGMKDTLYGGGGNGKNGAGAYMNGTNTNNGGWNSCGMRSYLNNSVYNVIDSNFKTLLKKHKNITSIGNRSDTIIASEDYLALPNLTEVVGNSYYGGNATQEKNSSFQFDYYKNISTVKNCVYEGYWTRSPYINNDTSFMKITSNGYGGYEGGYHIPQSISFFFVI